jgi:hypothetical protein
MGNAKGRQRIGQMFLFIPGVESGPIRRVCHHGAHHKEGLGHACSPESGAAANDAILCKGKAKSVLMESLV